MSATEEDQRLMRLWLKDRTPDAKKAYLDFRNNAYFFDTPSGNMEVAIRTLDTHTQWREWLSVRENQWWVEQCNQMSIPHVNLLVDIDPYEGETPVAFHDRIERAKRDLISDGGVLISDCHTGSRGRHMEFCVREWATISRETVRIHKRALLEYYGADTQKASPRNMILIPGMPNPKTGSPKTEVAA